MRFACGDVRDLIVSHKTNHGPAHRRYRALQQWRCLNMAFARFSASFDFRLLQQYRLPAQPVAATQALNLSAGVSNCKVSRGRSLS